MDIIYRQSYLIICYASHTTKSQELRFHTRPLLPLQNASRGIEGPPGENHKILLRGAVHPSGGSKN